MANSVDQDQTAPIGAVCSGSTLFASILNSPVMSGNYLQQTTSADNISDAIFHDALRVNKMILMESQKRTLSIMQTIISNIINLHLHLYVESSSLTI